MSDKIRVLVAPLDWGLGHATRCIPIIYKLINEGFEVLIAADGQIKKLLEIEFPALQFIFLEGYRVKYARSKRGLWWKLLSQLPQILSKIRSEHQWLKTVVVKHNIHLVISDNRYGLYHPRLHSVFITHQLLIQAPFFQNALQFFHYRLINKFNECWIPDVEDQTNLSGMLSHPKKLPSIPLKYIGFLSRFKKEPLLSQEKELILVLLSGPEPQRTLLEHILVAQLEGTSQTVLFVRGVPGRHKAPSRPGSIKFVNHLPAKDLEIKIKQSSLVIARAGYSTIMDLVTLKKKSILIPTPGQTEQEYLSSHLTKHKLALCIPQSRFNLQKALEDAHSFPYTFYEGAPDDLLVTVIHSLKTKNNSV